MNNNNTTYNYDDYDDDLMSTFRNAIEEQDYDTIESLIDNGMPLNMPDDEYDGITPLIYLISDNNVELVKKLINKGANVNLPSYTGSTPLGSSMKNIEIAKLLIENNADINYKYDNNVSYLMMASFFQYYDFVKLLLQNGAHVNDVDNKGWTALFYAAISYNQEINPNNIKNIISILFDYKIDFTITDKNGHTALYYSRNTNRTKLRPIFGVYMIGYNPEIYEYLHKLIEEKTAELYKMVSSIAIDKNRKYLLPSHVASRITEYSTGLTKQFNKTFKKGGKYRKLSTKKTYKKVYKKKRKL
jgi:hypothetical protein